MMFQKENHDLVISFEIEVEDKFKRFLKKEEAVRGEPFKLKIVTTNMGKNEFPGGKISNFSIRWNVPAASGARTAVPEDIFFLPKLQPNETHAFEDSFIPLDSGMARITLTIESSDKGKIRYYQNASGKPLDTNEWLSFFYVVDENQIKIIHLLEELIEKISGKS